MTEKEKDMPNNEPINNGNENEQSMPENEAAQGGDSGANELQQKEKELTEMRDKYLRLVAEFDNFRKRTAKERIELMQTANKEVIIALLDVMDDTDRATQQLENSQDINAIKDGVMLVFNKLKSSLQAKGLKKMEAQHTTFDLDLHDAITEIPAPTEDLKGKVLDVLQQGYYLNDKLIRHARVVVGK